MGPGTGGMHFRTPHRARSGRQSRSFPDRDAPGLPAPRLSRDLHVPAGAQRLLLKRLASAPVADKRENRTESLYAEVIRGGAFPLGKQYLGGLLHHALASTVLANPTVNAYRRFRINSLAPDRAAWGLDHRGVMLRVLGGTKDPATPHRKPHGRAVGKSVSLYRLADRLRALMASTMNAIPALPRPIRTRRSVRCFRRRSADALTLSNRSPCSETEFGKTFVDYYTKIKRTELQRYETLCQGQRHRPRPARRPRSGSRTSISISSDERAPARQGNKRIPAMTTLERMRDPVARRATPL